MATTFKRWLLIFAVALVTAPRVACGQSVVHWTAYKMADGLAEPVFDSIFFTPQGKLLASRFNAPLASELDGYSVTNFPAPAAGRGRICESPGGQRWAFVPQGLMEFKNDSWLLHSVMEINSPNSSRPAGKPEFIPVRQGSVLFLLADGLMEFSAENPDQPHTIPIRLAAETQMGEFTGMASAHDERLWLCGTRGLARAAGPVRNVEPNTAWEEYLPPANLQLHDFRRPTPDSEHGLTLLAGSGTNGGKVVVTFDGQNWTALPASPLNFFCAWREPDQGIWAATVNALFQWSTARTNWVEHQEISAGQIFDVAIEPGGAFWLATADGLLRGSLPLWSRPEPVHTLDAPVNGMAADRDGWLYFIADDNLHLLRNEVHREYPLPTALHTTDATPALFTLKDGSLLVAGNNALFEFTPARGTFNELPRPDQGQPIEPLGALPDGGVCLYHNSGHPYFDEFVGARFRPWSNAPPVHSGDDPPTTLFTAQNGDLWLAGGHTMFWCQDGKWLRFASQDHNAPESVMGFADLKNAKILCATADELWEFDGRDWTLSRVRFNHINSLMQSRDGGIWLASNGGLFRFSGGVWLENGGEEGLPNNAVTALCQDQPGGIWAGNAHGLTVFHPEADPDAPRTYVRWLGDDRRRLTEGDTLNLLFGGQDKWKLTPRERLLYSYQVDQHGWSAFQDLTMVSFPEPTAGRHYVQVRTMDRNGNVDPVTATLDFTVITPWFRETRLWIILLLGVATAVFFAAVAWNRHRQLLHSYAAVEQKVAERTRELEIATRELLHSQKMNALGTLAAGIAHDFNNILSIIKGSAQIIEDNPGQPEKIRTRVSRIKTVVQQGAEIVDAMLGFGRSSDAAAAPCDVNAVVADTVKLLGDRFLREVEVKFEHVEALPQISTSREFIQQILLNFIFNAAEAMQGHKQITLTTRLASALPPEIVLAPTPAPAFILVSVQDQGAGIPPEIKARIFEPFFTTKALSTRRGTGLGLSMVYELAKKMGAGLAVQSSVGHGSTFTLIVPVLAEPLLQKPAPVPTQTLHT